MLAAVRVGWLVVTVFAFTLLTYATCAWFRAGRVDVQDEAGRSYEPAPFNGIALTFMAVSCLAYVAAHLTQPDSLNWVTTLFWPAFICYAISAGWYLLVQRFKYAHISVAVKAVSAVTAATFGAVTAIVQ